MKRTIAVLATCAAVLVSGSMVPARAADPVAELPDVAEALALEARIADHIHYGQVYEQRYNSPARITGDIATTEGEDDSALYTGNYLGAEAFRYALAKRKIAEGVDVPFWVGQRNEALARVDEMTKQFHILTNISAYWKTKLNPQLHGDKPLANGAIDFGGGVFPAQEGLLFRACTPDTAAAFVNQQGRGNRVFGPFHWPGAPVDPYVKDAGDYYCRDATSRDAYAGTTFGLLTAFDLVSGDRPKMRRMIRDDILAISNYTLQYAWSTPRMHGRVVLPEIVPSDVLPQVGGGNDLDNFWSPLFMYTPVQQLNMAGIARHVASAAGSQADKLKWNAVWAAEIATQGPNLAEDMLLNTAQPHDSYYKFHLDYLALFNLIRTEPNALVNELFLRRALGVMDATTGDDGNALYDAFVYAVSGDPGRLADGVSHTNEWLDYRARLDSVDNEAARNDTFNSPRCAPSHPRHIECMPKDSTEVLVGGVPLITIPGTEHNGAACGAGAKNSECRARIPLDVVDRKGQDFLWQKDPTLLDEDQVPEWEAPGYDFLLPYWMIRYYSETAPLSRKPLPVWPGPTFR